MTLEQTQKKTGHLSEDSPNPTKRTGRGEGREGGQKTVGHLSEESGPNPGQQGPDDGFTQTQDEIGVTSMDSKPGKSHKSGRIDEVRDITPGG